MFTEAEKKQIIDCERMLFYKIESLEFRLSNLAIESHSAYNIRQNIKKLKKAHVELVVISL